MIIYMYVCVCVCVCVCQQNQLKDKSVIQLYSEAAGVYLGLSRSVLLHQPYFRRDGVILDPRGKGQAVATNSDDDTCKCNDWLCRFDYTLGIFGYTFRQPFIAHCYI